jgi:hypothetical protein
MLEKGSIPPKNIIHQTGCQITFLNELADPLGLPHVLWQRRNRLRRIVKRRSNYMIHFCSDRPDTKKRENPVNTATLKSGDQVRIKTREEVKGTLDCWNQLKGCAFVEEMWPYCGTTQKVFKPVEKFLDERDYLMKKCQGIFILDGLMCQGTKDFGKCDRSCYYFWRQEWLEKIE